MYETTRINSLNIFIAGFHSFLMVVKNLKSFVHSIIDLNLMIHNLLMVAIITVLLIIIQSFSARSP